MKQCPILEIGTSKIICMLSTANRNGRNIPVSSYSDHDGIQNGAFVDRGRTSAAIVSAVEETEISSSYQISRIICNVPGCFLKIEIRESTLGLSEDTVSEADIERLKSMAAPVPYSDAVHIGTRYVYFIDSSGDIYIDPPVGARTSSVSLCTAFYYAATEYTSLVESALEKLNITVAAYIPDSFAQAMSYIPSEQRDRSAVLLDIGYSQTSVSAVYADAVISEKTFYMGYSDIAGDIAIALDTDMFTAYSIRKNHLFGSVPEPGALIYGKDSTGKMAGFDAVKVKNAIEKRTRIIANEAERIIDGMSSLLQAKAPVYLTGSDSNARGFSSFLSLLLGRPVIPVRQAKDMFSSDYNTSLALLDNAVLSLYDLNEELAERKPLKERIKDLFK